MTTARRSSTSTARGSRPAWRRSRRWCPRGAPGRRPIAAIAASSHGSTGGSSAGPPSPGTSSREVYAGVAWESVYVDAAARGRGVGLALLDALIPTTEAAGIWSLIAGVQANNEASLALHERAGFRRIGVQERIGRDASGTWRDVVLLERRSAVIGS
jgi:L-amino acid N-acyltransferase YncA